MDCRAKGPQRSLSLKFREGKKKKKKGEGVDGSSGGVSCGNLLVTSGLCLRTDPSACLSHRVNDKIFQ